MLAAVLFAAWPARAEEPAVTEELRLRALDVLRDTLANEPEWVKVHAAEFLLGLRYTEGVRATFETERELHEDQPQYRMGIWRVLAKASPSDDARDAWVANIRGVLTNPASPDRLHAAETLAKFYYAANAEEVVTLDQDVHAGDGPLAAFAACILIHSGRTEYEEELAKLLDSDDARTRMCAAYALRHVDDIQPDTWKKLVATAEKETEDSTARTHLYSAAFVHAPNEEAAAPLKKVLLACVDHGAKSEKYEAVAALALRGDAGDIDLLTRLLDDPEADVRSGAAYALLRIGRRAPHPLHALDWVAIAAYIAVMLGIGLYYARRTVNTEDYLLGGRRMNPVTVGLSMFATLLSTLTYLALPGEMIKHGPMIIAQYSAYPLIFLVIGFVLIPVIMRQRVTSAYEILEQRLGPSVRTLGSLFFLLLRFMWMALIIYATSSKILVPLMQLDPSLEPVVCALLGLVTIAYTSLGGLRAVVVTDVMQTVVLFGGALLALGIITYKMGGVAAWFPDTWSPHWDPVRIMYEPSARITVAGAMTSYFVWHMCTAGSDQVAIQRYLATRNPAAARRVVLTSMGTDAIVGTFLGMLGVALYSFFQAHPQMLPDNYHSLQNADTLFPRFIALGLPMGISGLVIAGLLAAAMSSLSSGVNSSCLVISVDFMDRFKLGTPSADERAHVRQMRVITVFVGVAVIALSIAAGYVGGNLLEVVYRLVNLLVAPLFILFFMALFVPWATAPATIAAGLASAAMAVAIAYFEFLGLSFIWIMPMALLTGVIVGPTLSLLPWGGRNGASG